MVQFERKTRTNIIVALCLGVLAILPFLFNLHDPFVSDDWDFLSIAAGREKPVWQYFSTNYLGNHDGGSYRPMVNVFWFTAFKFFELEPFGYHAVTLAFHAANTMLLFFLCLSLPWIRGYKSRLLVGIGAGILFALFPNHAESVIWISVVNDTIMTFFYLVSLVLLLRVIRGKRSWPYLYAGSLISFFLALLTKEMAITLPAIIGLFMVYELVVKRRGRESWWKYGALFVPYLAVLAAYFVVRYVAIGIFLGNYTGTTVIINTFFLWRSYVSIVLSHFFTDATRVAITGFFYTHKTVLAMSMGAGMLVLAYITKRQRCSWFPWMLFVLFLVSVVPVLQFGVNYSPPYFSEEGERYAYLPSVWVALLLSVLIFGACAAGIQNRKRHWTYIVLGVFLVFNTISLIHLVQKNQRWHRAALVADSTLESAMMHWQERSYDGIVLIGMPDTYHGAFIFRNAFPLAMKLRLADAIDLSQILVTDNRTVYEENQTVDVERIDQSRFTYRVIDGGGFIVAQPRVDTHDYLTLLPSPEIELSAISHTHFDTSIDFTLSESFLEQNKHRQIGIWFFSPNGWIEDIPRADGGGSNTVVQ